MMVFGFEFIKYVFDFIVLIYKEVNMMNFFVFFIYKFFIVLNIKSICNGMIFIS